MDIQRKLNLQKFIYCLDLNGQIQAVPRRCTVKKSVLKNFAKFTEKQLGQSLVFNKVVIVRNFIKKRDSNTSVFIFPVNFAKFLRTLFLIKHLWWLLIYI